MKVTVEIAEIHKSHREIEVPDDATDEQIRALAKEKAGDADETYFEYDDTLAPEKWTIRKENGDYVS